MLGAVALIMALLYRKRSGTGQLVELPQLNFDHVRMAHIVRRPDGSVLGKVGLDPLQLGRDPSTGCIRRPTAGCALSRPPMMMSEHCGRWSTPAS